MRKMSLHLKKNMSAEENKQIVTSTVTIPVNEFRTKGYATSMPFSQLGLNGIVHLKKLHVKNYRPPQISVLNFLPPRHVILGLENLDIGLGSEFIANAPPIVVEGSLDGSISGMTLALTTEMLTDINGRMSAVVRNCSALISNSQVTLNPTGPMAIFVKTFEPMINNSVRQRIPDIFCSRLQSLIEKNISKLFNYITTIRLEEYFPKMNKAEKDVMNVFISHLAKGMYVDNRMMTQPLITMDYIETNHQGEAKSNSPQTPSQLHSSRAQCKKSHNIHRIPIKWLISLFPIICLIQCSITPIRTIGSR
uniref:BPI2 domain-containing protein n=1 Tax=Caenorhabditis japonica TaxID=281687 RepID=A0A8R1I7L5_CAEJA